MGVRSCQILLQALLIITFTNIFQAASASVQLYHHRAFHSSIVLRKYLYIHGGEITTWNGSGNGYSSASNLLTLPNNHTYSVDLSIPWTDATVNFTAFDGSAPTLNRQALWADTSGASFYAYDGGLSYSTQISQLPQQPPQTANQLLNFTPSGNAGTWNVVYPQLRSNFTNLVRGYQGIYASGNGLGFALSGVENAATSSDKNIGAQTIRLPGMVMFNISTQEWYNLSSSGYSSNGLAADSGAHFVPVYGVGGLMLIFGGTDGSTPAPPNIISIFDPISQQWGTQATSGNGPNTAFSNPCVIGVPGDNNTYEIFLFGGAGATADQTIAQGVVFVLSLPSFNWQRQDAMPTVGRFYHSCNIIGNRQMVSIGGAVANGSEFSLDSSLTDPFPNGIGIFDMTNMQWTDSYNPNAAPYVTPSSVKAYIQQHGAYPSAWTNDVVKGWFTKATSTNSTSQSQSPPQSPPASSPPKNTGAIAGGVVGGIAAAVLIGLSAFFYLRHRKQTRPTAVSEKSSRYEKPELGNNVRAINELNGRDRRFELPQKENATSELNSEALPQELGLPSAHETE